MENSVTLYWGNILTYDLGKDGVFLLPQCFCLCLVPSFSLTGMPLRLQICDHTNYQLHDCLTGIPLFGFGRVRKTPALQISYSRKSTEKPFNPPTTIPQISPTWWCRLPLLRHYIYEYSQSDAVNLFRRGRARALWLGLTALSLLLAHIFPHKMPKLINNN